LATKAVADMFQKLPVSIDIWLNNIFEAYLKSCENKCHNSRKAFVL
jgi:hypothetical protein